MVSFFSIKAWLCNYICLECNKNINRNNNGEQYIWQCNRANCIKKKKTWTTLPGYMRHFEGLKVKGDVLHKKNDDIYFIDFFDFKKLCSLIYLISLISLISKS